MYDVWHGKGAMQLGHIKRNRGPDNYSDGSSCLDTRKLNVVLTWQNYITGSLHTFKWNQYKIRNVRIWSPHLIMR